MGRPRGESFPVSLLKTENEQSNCCPSRPKNYGSTLTHMNCGLGLEGTYITIAVTRTQLGQWMRGA